MAAAAAASAAVAQEFLLFCKLWARTAARAASATANDVYGPPFWPLDAILCNFFCRIQSRFRSVARVFQMLPNDLVLMASL